MGLRSDLQTIFEDILDSENVYFQPPANVQMQYPAIVYRRFDIRTSFADDRPYIWTVRYLVTLIAREPELSVRDRISALPMCVYQRYFAVDNLNHDVFQLYF